MKKVKEAIVSIRNRVAGINHLTYRIAKLSDAVEQIQNDQRLILDALHDREAVRGKPAHSEPAKAERPENIQDYNAISKELSMLVKKANYLQRRVDQANFMISSMQKIIASSLSDKDSLHACKIRGEKYVFYDLAGSCTAYYVGSEMEAGGVYDVDGIGFSPGDVIVDIGANVGIVSIYLALRYPFVKVFSFEPIERNFKNFQKNIEMYSLKNIVAEQRAVTSDGREIDMMMIDVPDTGGTTIYDDFSKYSSGVDGCKETVKSISINEIFEKYGIEKCKLLKIDCEGAEFEILPNADVLPRVEHLRGEIHRRGLKHSPLSVDDLVKHCEQSIKPENIILKVID